MVMDIDGPPFAITQEEPTPIVEDFGAFLDAVEAPSAYLSEARRTLDRATLWALDGRVRSHPTDTRPRTDQEFYPLLNMFQRICMSTRLHVIDKVGGRLRMVLAGGCRGVQGALAGREVLGAPGGALGGLRLGEAHAAREHARGGARLRVCSRPRP
jgi:hypothetical protein